MRYNIIHLPTTNSKPRNPNLPNISRATSFVFPPEQQQQKCMPTAARIVIYLGLQRSSLAQGAFDFSSKVLQRYIHVRFVRVKSAWLRFNQRGVGSCFDRSDHEAESVVPTTNLETAWYSCCSSNGLDT